MKLTRRSTITDAASGSNSLESKVMSLCYSPDDERLAVATADRIISIYDDQGERVDKISTKPNDKGPKNYLIMGMRYAPDKDRYKLAVAQSDSIVFVYKWSLNSANDEGQCVWDGKKSICNKFSESAPVMALVWPSNHPNEVIYGLSDGKVKLGLLKSNKSYSVYNGESMVVSMASHPDGSAILSAHVDGSIYKFSFQRTSTESQESSCVKIVQQSYPAYALSWGRSILASGDSRQLTFYDERGQKEQSFNYDNGGYDSNPSQEFTVASFNKSGDTVVVGNFDCFLVFSSNNNRKWNQISNSSVENMYNVTAISWKSNGSCFALGAMCGLVDIYQSCRRRYVKNDIVITHVSPSQVHIKNKNLADPAVLTMESSYNFGIKKVSIHKDPETRCDRYAVAFTDGSLIIQDLEETNKATEVEWGIHESSSIKFMFEFPNACIVSDAGELSVIEYDENEIIGSFRTEFASGHLLSLRIKRLKKKNSSVEGDFTEIKKVSYLLDQQTICVQELNNSSGIQTVYHDHKIDFMELSEKGDFIMFRDKTGTLYLCDLTNLSRRKLLDFSSYAQWVPDSDVIVAQSNDIMCVFYNINAPDQVVTRRIAGEIESIERMNGKTEIIVDDGVQVSTYELAEDMIDFGSAMDTMDVQKAMGVLQKMEMSPQSEELWSQLQEVSLEQGNLIIAERCAAAIGDVSCSNFLRRILSDMNAEKNSGVVPMNDWRVQAKLFQLQKEFAKAEMVYIANNRIDEAISMYESLEMHPDAIRLCQQRKPSLVEEKKSAYIQWLSDTRQDLQLLNMKIAEGKIADALALGLRAGMPLMSYRILMGQKDPKSLTENVELVESIITALFDSGYAEQAGEIFLRLNKRKQALETFLKGPNPNFSKAIEIARLSFPHQVVNIEGAWGEHLLSEKQYAQAIEHFIEAHDHEKAFLACVQAKRFDDASQLAEQVTHIEGMGPQFEILAHHFMSQKKYKEAMKIFQVYQDIGEAAEKRMDQVLQREVDHLKENSKFSELIDLYSDLKPSDLPVVRLWVANQLADLGRLKEAEKQFTLAGAWVEIVKMYRGRNMWHDAIRVARSLDDDAVQRVAYAFFLDLGVGNANAASTLDRVDVLEPAIYFAYEINKYEHVQILMGYVEQKNPKQAIAIYSHLEMWSDADRVESSMQNDNDEERFVSDADAVDTDFEQSQIEKGLALDRQQRYDEAIDCYLETNGRDLRDDELEEALQNALRVSQKCCPERYDEVANIASFKMSKSKTKSKTDDIDHDNGGALVQEPAKRPEKTMVADAINAMIVSGKFHEAVSQLLQLGPLDFNDPSNLSMYRNIVACVLGTNNHEEHAIGKKKLSQLIEDLKTALYKSWTKFHHHASGQCKSKFMRMLMATHYTTVMHVCVENDLTMLAAKCAITLLRYDDLVPSDKAYFVAGQLCKEIATDLSYKLLAHYVEIVQAIEDGMESVDNPEFETATAIPGESSIPSGQYIVDEAERENTRDWVLSMCMNAKVAEKNLPCESGATGIYEGLFEKGLPQCVLTGYPVQVKDQLHGHDFIANRHEWNALVTKTRCCPWSGSSNPEALLQ